MHHSENSQDPQDSNLSDESNDEEIIKSDNDTVESDGQASPVYSSASLEDNEVDHIKTTPSKGRNELCVSQSPIIDKSQIKRGLKTFTAYKSFISLDNWEQAREDRDKRF